MEAHLTEWLSLLVRWAHFIIGVAWIGASFYFNWLENHLNREAPQERGIDGNLWAVHGGGFYHLKKYENGPEKLPDMLHWFKWEAYITWLSGVTLLAIVYYYNAEAMMIDSSVSKSAFGNALGISPITSSSMAIMIGIASMWLSWIVYDVLCKSSLKEKPLILGLVIFAYLAGLAFFLSQFLSGRAAYIHVGAAIGTIMAANVFFVIIPAQKELVKALVEARIPDSSFGKSGLLRSRHNNYLTLPVLFTMISSHFPSTYGNKYSWLVLIAVAAVGVLVRHFFNIRHLKGKSRKALWMLPTALFGFALIAMATMPPKPKVLSDAKHVTTSQIMPVIQQRCMSCHSTTPTQKGFASPSAGLAYDKAGVLENNADKVYSQVAQRQMPLGNLTQMTDTERLQVERWYQTLKLKEKIQ